MRTHLHGVEEAWQSQQPPAGDDPLADADHRRQDRPARPPRGHARRVRRQGRPAAHGRADDHDGRGRRGAQLPELPGPGPGGGRRSRSAPTSSRCSSARIRSTSARCGRGCTRSDALRRSVGDRHASTSPSGTSPARSPACRCTGCWARTGTRSPCTSHPGFTRAPRTTREEAIYWREQGWKGYKLHPPTSPYAVSPGRTGAGRHRRLRRGARGGGRRRWRSCSTRRWAYSYAEALTVGRAIEELGFTWYEDPLPAEDIHGYVQAQAAPRDPDPGDRDHARAGSTRCRSGSSTGARTCSAATSSSRAASPG